MPPKKKASIFKKVLIITFCVFVTVLLLSGIGTYLVTGDNSSESGATAALNLMEQINQERAEPESSSLLEVMGYGLLVLVSAFGFLVIGVALQHTLEKKEGDQS